MLISLWVTLLDYKYRISGFSRADLVHWINRISLLSGRKFRPILRYWCTYFQKGTCMPHAACRKVYFWPNEIRIIKNFNWRLNQGFGEASQLFIWRLKGINWIRFLSVNNCAVHWYSVQCVVRTNYGIAAERLIPLDHFEEKIQDWY